jgi:hypothetical protein
MHTGLEQFLQEYSELVLVNLWEKSCEASLQNRAILRPRESIVPESRNTNLIEHHWKGQQVNSACQFDA